MGKKISELIETNALTGNEIVPIVQNGENKKVNVNNLEKYINRSCVPLNENQKIDVKYIPNITTTGTTITTPKYASSISDMTDTDKVYIGSNGHLWAYENQPSASVIWHRERKISYTVGDTYDNYATQSLYISTELIPVSEGDTISFSAVGFDPDWYSSGTIIAYNSSKNVISVLVKENQSLGTFSHTITVPTGASYIAIRGYADNQGSGAEYPIWENATFTGISDTSSGWVDTGITYANYSLTEDDKSAIAQYLLNYLDVTHIDLQNTLTIGNYELRYEGDDTLTDLGEVNNV